MLITVYYNECDPSYASLVFKFSSMAAFWELFLEELTSLVADVIQLITVKQKA